MDVKRGVYTMILFKFNGIRSNRTRAEYPSKKKKKKMKRKELEPSKGYPIRAE